MKVSAILNDNVKQLTMLYAPDMEDAITLARVLAKSGFYHVQIGPMNSRTQGVRVRVWDGVEQPGKESANEQDKD